MGGGAGRATRGGASALERAVRPVRSTVPLKEGLRGLERDPAPVSVKGGAAGLAGGGAMGGAVEGRGTGTCKRRSITDLRGAWIEGHWAGLVGGRWKEVWKALTGSEGLRGGLYVFGRERQELKDPMEPGLGEKRLEGFGARPRSFGTRPERCVS